MARLVSKPLDFLEDEPQLMHARPTPPTRGVVRFGHTLSTRAVTALTRLRTAYGSDGELERGRAVGAPFRGQGCCSSGEDALCPPHPCRWDRYDARGPTIRWCSVGRSTSLGLGPDGKSLIPWSSLFTWLFYTWFFILVTFKLSFPLIAP